MKTKKIKVIGDTTLLPLHIISKLETRDCIIAEILKKQGIDPGPCAKAIHGS